MRRRHGQPQRSLHALLVSIQADELREPYPRLAQLMQALAIQSADPRDAASLRMACG